MKIHPYCEMFPEFQREDWGAFVADVKRHGLRDPIVTFDGKILDGRSRVKACKESGRKIRTVEFGGTEDEALAFVMSHNLHRRHLTPGQKAVIVDRWMQKRASKSSETNGKSISARERATTVREAAAGAGIAHTTLTNIRSIRESGAIGLYDKVARGDLEVTVAAREAKRLKPKHTAKRTNRKPTGASSGIYTLTEWKRLSDERRTEILETADGKDLFNAQQNEDIEWAKWSWNPVTGCKHPCPYCYAREIANKIYTQKFVPTIIPSRLAAPLNTAVPSKARSDETYRNVFVCSMADLFGRWVPSEWIHAVLDVCAENSQWNFLFLTKFPKRYAEFEFPDNAWMGTTVDAQKRVRAAEDAMADVKATIKWLSIEPMLEPLQFSDLGAFDWLVIGGASQAGRTGEWRVPSSWWVPLYTEARSKGMEVFMKTNLFLRERGVPTQKWKDPQLPRAFDYLSGKSKDDVMLGERA